MKTKKLEICTIIFYIVATIMNIIMAIKTKDGDKVFIAFWIFNTMTMFILYRQADELGDRRVEWTEQFIKKLLSNNLKGYESSKYYCIHYKNKKPEILFNARKNYTERFQRVDEAKKIASHIIGCEFVDGRNLYIDGEYVAGVYIDDMEMMSQRHEMVIINEIDGLDRSTCEKIIEYLKTNNDFTAELKEYELI